MQGTLISDDSTGMIIVTTGTNTTNAIVGLNGRITDSNVLAAGRFARDGSIAVASRNVE
jgi:hypothetical protein